MDSNDEANGKNVTSARTTGGGPDRTARARAAASTAATDPELPFRHLEPRAARRQRGATLVVSLLLLICVTVLSTTAVSMSVMELRMSSNVEANVNNFQTGAAAVDYVLSDASNLPVIGPLNVPTPVPLAGTPFATEPGDSVTASAVRVADCAPPPRMAAATSMKNYSAFNFEVSANVKKHTSGMGEAGMVQGYIVLGPKC
jgi:hypothetical protein